VPCRSELDRMNRVVQLELLPDSSMRHRDRGISSS
jgi:hypothetical protein